MNCGAGARWRSRRPNRLSSLGIPPKRNSSLLRDSMTATISSPCGAIPCGVGIRRSRLVFLKATMRRAICTGFIAASRRDGIRLDASVAWLIAGTKNSFPAGCHRLKRCAAAQKTTSLRISAGAAIACGSVCWRPAVIHPTCVSRIHRPPTIISAKTTRPAAGGRITTGT